MEIFFTKDKHWLKQWDEFVLNDNFGSHLMYSEWNRSFNAYGFDFEICICTYNNIIVGGFAAVQAKVSFFKFYVVPIGPIVSSSFEGLALNELVCSIKTRAIENGCCYAHFNLAQSSISNSHVTQIQNFSAANDMKSGHLFKYIYSSSGINWIDLVGFDDETKIESLKASVRRNIRNSYRKDLQLAFMNSEEMIAEGYNLFIENSKSMGYDIRNWNDIKSTFFQLNTNDVLQMLGAYKNDVLKGAILLLKAGNYYTYVLGGSKKEIPDLRTGDFLQWEAIKLSLEQGFDGYNISIGGSKGVVDFKNSFNTLQIPFESGKYHWILKSKTFRTFQLVQKYIKPYKKLISRILTIFRN